MNFQESILISANQEKIFSVYAKVAEWPLWDKEVESVSMQGDFKLGNQGKIKPKGAPESKIVLVELTKDHSFTIECTLPLCKMHFIHVLTNAGEGATKVVNELKFSGLLAPLFGRVIGKGISKTMPQTLAGLKKHVESIS